MYKHDTEGGDFEELRGGLAGKCDTRELF